MAVFNEPAQWSHELGNNADVKVLPDDTSGSTGDLSLQKLWQAINQLPVEAGGIAPDRTDINSVIKYLGDQIFYTQNGGVPSYNPDYEYTVGRVILFTDGNLWKCIQPNTITVGGETVHVAPDSVDPVGTDYWQQLDGENTSTSLIPNQTIISELPLTDANLHIKDGALLSGSGAYSAYVDLIAELYNGGTASTSFCTEAEWQTSNTNYGFCNKFVYDSVANTVRLPKVNSLHGALIKSYSSTSDWYRIYQDGWVEQGGVRNHTVISVTYLVPFIDTNYYIAKEVNYSGTNAPYFADISFYNLTTTGATTRDGSGGNPNYSWYACGYCDISDLQVSPIYEYIVVGTIVKTEIQIDIDQVMADLALKADKDFTNIDNTAKIAIAHNAMPSDTYDDLTLGATGATYTAPADGYAFIQKGTSGTSQSVVIVNTTTNLLSVGAASSGIATGTFLPVKKGDTFQVNYTAGGALVYFRFVYAVGSESEQ